MHEAQVIIHDLSLLCLVVVRFNPRRTLEHWSARLYRSNLLGGAGRLNKILGLCSVLERSAPLFNKQRREVATSRHVLSAILFRRLGYDSEHLLVEYFIFSVYFYVLVFTD